MKEESKYKIGANVVASFDQATSSLNIYSKNGILWTDWEEMLPIHRADIKFIKVIEGTLRLPQNSAGIFACMTNLCEIDMQNIDTSQVRTMRDMFANSGIIKADLSGCDLSNTIDMQNMFSGCINLTSVKIGGNGQTIPATKMQRMFENCYQLSTVDICDCKIQEVTNMHGMFSNCLLLRSVNMTGIDTSKVTDMAHMFQGCLSLRKIDISHFNISGVTHINQIFYNCRNLEEVVMPIILRKDADTADIFLRCHENLSVISV